MLQRPLPSEALGEKLMEALKPLEHKFKAIVFSLCKLFFAQGQKEFEPIDGNAIKKVLFLRPEKLGDMIISFPVFDGLKKHFPHIEISILASLRSKAIIQNDKRFSKIYMYLKNPLKDFTTLRKIRKAKYDCVVDMIGDDSVTALFLSQLAAPGKPRIGIGKTKYKKYYDYNYLYRTNNTNHIIENTLKILDAFGIDSSKESGYAEPYVSTQELEFAKKTIQGLKKSDKTKVIGYNLSAGAINRIWAKEKSTELLQKIIAQSSDNHILLFTTPDERERAKPLLDALSENVYLIPENLSLTSVAALIKYLDILISPDTSLVHIARAFDVPVVGLYSKFMKNFMLWRPYDQKVGAVVSSNEHNIFDITVEQVFDTFKILTESRKTVEQ